MTFKKGESGNPTGRPIGAKDKRAELRKLLDPHADNLVQKAVAMALEGDSTAMRLCIERIVPAYRAEGIPVHVPALAEAKTLTEKGDAALQAIANGDVTVANGGTLLAAIAQQTKIQEFDELDRRLKALEKRGAR